MRVWTTVFLLCAGGAIASCGSIPPSDDHGGDESGTWAGDAASDGPHGDPGDGDGDGSTGDPDASSTNDGSSRDGDAANGDGGSPPPSCAPGGPGMDDCGPGGATSCCTTYDVPGGTYFRGYDGVTPGYTVQRYPATVSAFRLDAYEVTVGRFRHFVNAVVAGWLPPPHSGKHTHLNGGQGLEGGTETGWDPSWNSRLPTTLSDWQTNLATYCNPDLDLSSPAPTANDKLPINCADWFESYAFCIWDGGFLPSEAEWGFAASGGSEQRVYPWSVPPTSTAIDCSHANYYTGSTFCGNGQPTYVPFDLIDVGTDPAGNGKWGHADLAGNLLEWTVDWNYLNADGITQYEVPCVDCANVTPSTSKMTHGGSFADKAAQVLASGHLGLSPNTRQFAVARCARSP